MGNRKFVSLRVWTILTAACFGFVPVAGCRICADCEDLAYPAYGGAWQRTNRDSGRVGSVFDPAGGKAPELVDRDDPLSADTMERKRQIERGGGYKELSPLDDGGKSEEAEEPGVDPGNELRNRKLEDIPESEREEELRKKNLGDINVRLIPAPPEPSELR